MKNCKSQVRSVHSQLITLSNCTARWPERRSPFRFVLALVFSLALLATSASAGDHVLYNFAGTPDGATSADTLVADTFGNLYGTTVDGGAFGYGSVYVMCAPGAAAPDILPCLPGSAGWTENVLYSFKGVPGSDGASPYGTLIFNSLYAGRAFTLYGTTYYGGVSSTGTVCNGNTGCGTVFELCAPHTSGGCGPVSGGWAETVLHAFTGGKDGAYPYGGVITDKASDLYGTTVYGGGLGTCLIGTVKWYCGTAFRLKPNTTFSTWTETIMHRFKGGVDGANPYAALCCNTIFSNAFFYGTTLRGGVASGGGAGNSGIVFKLQNVAGYPETILYDFCNLLGCPDGAHPYANVIFDANSNMYGTTAYGGGYAHGTAYEMPGPAYATENVLYNFCTGGFGCPDGATPYAGLTLDSANNLYGTTDLGGVGNGEVFQLPFPAYTPAATLQAFTGSPADGGNPWGGVIFDPTILPGTLFGATTADGSVCVTCGVVYSVP